MFFGEDRHEKMVKVILASDDEERRAALAELLPLQQADFEGIFEAMDGLPVTIRLLDPPLHEFLPKVHDVEAPGRARADRAHRRPRGARAHLRPGARRCRRSTRCSAPAASARDPLSGDLRDAGQAIFRALVAARARGVDVHAEIMVPLVDYRRELELLRELIERVGG